MRPATRLLICTTMMLSACNLPQPKPPVAGAVTDTASVIRAGGPGVSILSPADGGQLSGSAPVLVQFAASGGPFIEADLLVDNVAAGISIPLSSDDAAPSATLTWSTPITGPHLLTVEVVTAEKMIFTASVQVVVAGGAAPPAPATPTSEAAAANARQQVIQIMRDTYHVNLTAPPVMRKYRFGVANDPWVSVIYAGGWMYAISIYPDHVVQSPHPINQFSDGSVPIPSGEKAVPVCRASGTLTVLIVMVDFQNLGVTRDEALASLADVTTQLNADLARYSTQSGAKAPILKLQMDGAFLSPLPSMPGHLLTADQLKSLLGVDRANYDLVVQVDLDSNNTYRKLLAVQNLDTFGIQLASCHDQSVPSIWISLDSKDQALGQDLDKRLSGTLSHELLHTFGYPFEHSWPCGDGSAPDSSDQCDIGNWPSYILGWTDTDGDSIPEIIDPTPYGMTGP